MARHHFRHQSHQDFGRHRFTLALAAHQGDWAVGDAPSHAASLHQPLVAFQTEAHAGHLGREISFLDLDGDGVDVAAVKHLEDPGAAGDELVVRLVESRGETRRVSVSLGRGLAAAREVDGQERETAGLASEAGPPRLGRLEVELGRFQPRAFAVQPHPPEKPLAALESHPLGLDWNLSAASFHHRPETGGDFDGDGHALPGELLPAELTCGEVRFHLGPIEPGAENAMICRGQRLALPASSDVLYLLAAGAGTTDEEIEIEVGGEHRHLLIHPWSGFIGQKNRWPQYRGWRIGGEQPAYVRRTPVAWTGTHRHGPGATDQAYVFCYLYRYEVPVPDGVTEARLPRAENARIFAATAAQRGPTAIRPASELFSLY